VIAVTEKWAKEEIIDSELSVDGYVLYRKERKSDRQCRGGGVLILVKTSLKSKSNDEFSKLIKQATNVPLGTQIMILGDCNYPDIDYKNEEHGIGPGTGLEASEFLQIISECGLHQHVHDYTRYRADQNPSI